MTQYSIYMGGVSQVMDLDPGTTLGSLRQMLSKMPGSSSDDYDFVYYNPFTEQKTILNNRTLEGRKHIKDIAFNDTTVIMTVVQGSKTDLFGMKQDWLYNRHMGVQVSLNQGAEAQAVNSGKFEPVMLTDIQPSNSNSNVFYQNAVICEKGSIVRFDISSWAQPGLVTASPRIRRRSATHCILCTVMILLARGMEVSRVIRIPITQFKLTAQSNSKFPPQM